MYIAAYYEHVHDIVFLYMFIFERDNNHLWSLIHSTITFNINFVNCTDPVKGIVSIYHSITNEITFYTVAHSAPTHVHMYILIHTHNMHK